MAREVAARLDARHIERDALGDDEAPGFAALVAAAVEAAGRRWVFDGAPYNAEALVYPHACERRPRGGLARHRRALENVVKVLTGIL